MKRQKKKWHAVMRVCLVVFDFKLGDGQNQVQKAP